MYFTAKVTGLGETTRGKTICISKGPTNSMEQSPYWKANTSSATQEILRILWNPNVHYRTHKRQSPVRVLSQIDPVHFPSHFSRIYFNIILPSTPGSSKWSPFLRLSHKTSEGLSMYISYWSCLTFWSKKFFWITFRDLGPASKITEAIGWCCLWSDVRRKNYAQLINTLCGPG